MSTFRRYASTSREDREVRVAPMKRLLDVLREDLG